MLKLMREHAHSWLIKSVLWLVVAAFVGTIFYSWGMGRVAERQGMVAEVLNEKISYDEYREVLDNLYNFYRINFMAHVVFYKYIQVYFLLHLFFEI